MFCLDTLGVNPLRTPEKCPKLARYLNNSNLLFKNIIVSTPFTDGCISSMFTGLYGTVNGVDNWGKAKESFKRDQVITLPQILKILGYKNFYVGYKTLQLEASFFDNHYLMDHVQDMEAVGKHRVGLSDIKYREQHNRKYAEIINKTKGNKFVFVANMNYHDFNRCCDIDLPTSYWCEEDNEFYDQGMKFMDENLWIDFYDIDFEKDIVILFSDHGGRAWSDVYLDEEFVRCFWAIYAPKTKKRVIEKLHSSVDFLSVFLKLLGVTDNDVLQGKKDGSKYCVSFGGIADSKFTKLTSPDKPNQFLITDGEYYYYRHDRIGEMITKNWKDVINIHKYDNRLSDKKLMEFYKKKMNEIIYPNKSLKEFYENFKFKPYKYASIE